MAHPSCRNSLGARRTRPGSLGIFLIGAPEPAERQIEGVQAAADDLGLLRAGAARGALGIHGRTDRLQRSEDVGDPAWSRIRDRFAQRVQRLGEIVRAPLDVIPPGAASAAAKVARCFRHAHGVMQGRSLGVRVDEPDRQPAAAAERRRAERVIHTIRPIRTTTTAIRIHSHR